MEISSQEDHDIPIPINSTYGSGHGHMIHHNHGGISPPNNSNIPQMPCNDDNNNDNGHNFDQHHPREDHRHQHNHHAHVLYNSKKQVGMRYKECLKNHAASMGGNATDGCGEFMPSGEEGTIEALTCSACSCHRNFHRREVEGEAILYTPSRYNNRKLMLTHHPHNHKIRSAVPNQMIMPPSYNNNYVGCGSHPYMPNSESDDQMDVARPISQAQPQYNMHHHIHHGGQMGMMSKKRFRTKFTQEQKEKMLNFAERVGWKIQRQEESVVQQFCQEVGVKRRVLKVWMHNNKHNLAKNNNNNNHLSAATNDANHIATTTNNTANLASSA